MQLERAGACLSTVSPGPGLRHFGATPGTLLIILPASQRGARDPDPVPLPLHLPPPPPRAAIQLIESASGVSPQESQLSLGGQHCVGELDEELASAFPVFIRNAVLGQKQLKKARTEPCRSTDAVSMASHSGKCQPSLGQGGLGGQSPRPSARPTHLFFLL